MEPKWTLDAALFHKYQEESRFVQFLVGLHDEFEHVCTNILYCKPLPSVDEALSELLTEETRKGFLFIPSDFIFAANWYQSAQASSVYVASSLLLFQRTRI